MTAAEFPELRTRWADLWQRLKIPQARVPAIDPLLIAYGHPSRAYHNLHHITQCLHELERLRNFCDSPDAVELAIWFHDVVYDPTRPDNEEQSAKLAAATLRAASIPAPKIRDVESLILATNHTDAPQTNDARILVDIDLSILGQPADIFDAYENNIRREYAHVADAAFRTGRAAILRRFLDRPAIFSTPQMSTLYESPALQNLRRSLLKLESQ